MNDRVWVFEAVKLPEGFRPNPGRSAQLLGFPKLAVRRVTALPHWLFATMRPFLSSKGFSLSFNDRREKMRILNFAAAVTLALWLVAPAFAQNYPNQQVDPNMRRDQPMSRDEQVRRDEQAQRYNGTRYGDQMRQDDRRDQPMSRDDQMRRDEIARRDNGMRYSDQTRRDDRRHGYGWQQRHCHTVWYHHRRVRQCR